MGIFSMSLYFLQNVFNGHMDIFFFNHLLYCTLKLFPFFFLVIINGDGMTIPVHKPLIAFLLFPQDRFL